MDRERVTYRRLSNGGGNSNQGLRRSNSVRASFRLLSSRWKPPNTSASKNNNINNDTDNNNSSTTRTMNDKTETQNFNLKTKRDAKDFIIELFGRELSENVKNKIENELRGKVGNCKKMTKDKRVFSEDCLQIPKYVPPKAAALLHIRQNGVEEKSVISSRTVDVLSDQHLFQQPQRLATIRKGSVWANSTSSKN